MDTNTLTAEDQAWFQEPVSVQIEQDNRAWLDTMLEMKKAELVNYAVFQYAVPEAAAEAVGRDDLISMIVVANKAGGGQSVSRQEYIYIPELKGILEPAVSLFKADDDPLFLTRGSGSAQQVYDKVGNTWHNLEQLKRKHAQQVQETKRTANEAAADVSDHPHFNRPDKVLRPTLSEATMSVLPALKRDDLVKFAAELGIEGTEDKEAFPANKDVIAKLTEVNEANKAANAEG